MKNSPCPHCGQRQPSTMQHLYEIARACFAGAGMAVFAMWGLERLLT
jgi:hypothetical protein